MDSREKIFDSIERGVVISYANCRYTLTKTFFNIVLKVRIYFIKGCYIAAYFFCYDIAQYLIGTQIIL